MRNATLWQVVTAILLALAAGILIGPEASLGGISFVQVCGLIGQLFLNALMLVVVPLVCSSIIIGIARMGKEEAFLSLGAKTFSYFIGTVFVSLLVSFTLIAIFQPGVHHQAAFESVGVAAERLQIQNQPGPFQQFEQLLMRLVPVNIIAAASQAQMLGLIVFSMLFGFFLTKIEEQSASVILAFFQGIFQIMMRITQLIMKTLPVAVFALIAKVVASTGLESIYSVATFFGVVLLSLSVICLVVFPLLLKFIGGINPLSHFKAMMPALLTAFSTSSSAATMPVTIECLEKRAGISPRICSFVIPLGTAINMPGTGAYVCAAVFFIAQAYAIPLSAAGQAIILLVTLLISFGIAGVPSGSLFAVISVLSMAGLPAEGVSMIIAVERLLDMCRTPVNVFANSCCAALLAKAEEKQKDAAMPIVL